MSEILALAVDLEPRAITAAGYRLCCSPHEWTDDDSHAMAEYTFAAQAAMQEMRKDTDALLVLLTAEKEKTERLTRERDEAAEKERAAVVDWLNSEAAMNAFREETAADDMVTEFGLYRECMTSAAQAITTGSHREQSNGPE